MNKKITIALGTLALAFAFSTNSYALFDQGVKAKFDNSKKDNRQWKYGNNSGNQETRNVNQSRKTTTQNSHNRTTSSVNNSDNRSWSDSRNMSDNRQFNMRTNSHDLGAGARMNSHNVGNNSIMVSGGYKADVGNKKVKMGTVSGTNNYIDNSTSGYFGIGNTVQK